MGSAIITCVHLFVSPRAPSLARAAVCCSGRLHVLPPPAHGAEAGAPVEGPARGGGLRRAAAAA
eukprot:8670146-Pyramimonas_sp.AAC.1